MIPEQTLVQFPEFSDTGTKVKPGDAKYSAGFQEADVLPAEWLNWFLNKASDGISVINEGVTSIEAELNTIVTTAGETPDKDTNNQVLTAIQNMISNAKSEAILAAHPVGSLYWSNQSTDPGTIFGGTWTQIKDRFVWAKGDSDTVNATGGAKTVVLSESNLPSHSHTFTPSGSVASHTHTFTPSGSVSSHTHDEYIQSSSGTSILYVSSSAATGTKSGANFGTNPTSVNNRQIITTGSTKPTFTGTAGTTGSAEPTFTGTAGTTGSTGSGTAVDKMPPYIVKYCWERTA